MSSHKLTTEQRFWQRRRMVKDWDARRGTAVEVARRYGYARKSLFKWYRRWIAAGRDDTALREQSRAPHRRPRRLSDATVADIAEVARANRHLGLVRLHRKLVKAGLRISVYGVYSALKRAGVLQPRKRKAPRKTYRRIEHTVPGELVQADLMELESGGYQVTVIDSATRYLAACTVPTKDVVTVRGALSRLLEGLPFAVQVVQTDHGPEFTYAFMPQCTVEHPLDAWCRERGITHRLIPIRYPQANGKVERVHRICRTEFYRRYRLHPGQTWAAWLPKYVAYYNTRREHGSLDWQTPAERLAQLQQNSETQAGIDSHL